MKLDSELLFCLVFIDSYEDMIVSIKLYQKVTCTKYDSKQISEHKRKMKWIKKNIETIVCQQKENQIEAILLFIVLFIFVQSLSIQHRITL